jgi:hypothetical protein
VPAVPKSLVLDYKRKKMSLSSIYNRQELYTLLYTSYKNYASRAFLSCHVMHFTYFIFQTTLLHPLPSLDQPLGSPPTTTHSVRVNQVSKIVTKWNLCSLPKPLIVPGATFFCTLLGFLKKQPGVKTTHKP